MYYFLRLLIGLLYRPAIGLIKEKTGYWHSSPRTGQKERVLRNSQRGVRLTGKTGFRMKNRLNFGQNGKFRPDLSDIKTDSQALKYDET